MHLTPCQHTWMKNYLLFTLIILFLYCFCLSRIFISRYYLRKYSIINIWIKIFILVVFYSFILFYFCWQDLIFCHQTRETVAATLSMEIFLCLGEVTLHCIEVGLPSYQKMAVSVDFTIQYWNDSRSSVGFSSTVLQIEVLEPAEIKSPRFWWW